MTAKSVRTIRIDGCLAYVPLSNGMETVIDAEDVPLVQSRNWHAQVDRRADGSVRAIYAVRHERSGGKRRKISMHRVIMGNPVDLHVDHRDGDGLNNRRRGATGNLRVATRSQNQQNGRLASNNTSGVKGVSWHSGRQQWHAEIRCDGRRVHIGWFDDIGSAEEEIEGKRDLLHGDFRRHR